jgi:uncharacterized Rmd1/YagE family protein
MDCRAYCTASSYKIKHIYEFLKARYKASMIREVLHIEVVTEMGIGNAFYFPYGSIVCWGIPKEKELQLLEEIKPFEENPNEVETDEFTYIYGEPPKIVEDEIILPNHDVITKVAISHGISQSVKLGTFEIVIQKTYNQSKNLPEDLARYGRISLSKKEIRRKMGELFIERSNINLHVDALDTPEFFWEYPELEFLYVMTAKYLDLETRVEVLNHRLDVVHELFEMLGSELNHQHSSRLEWIIILLIVSEVTLTLLLDVFRVI